ncbi:MAG: hypothetical protein LUC33_07065 [Prevotellaceae bacterium]|nr:hypothetical protein [Prevotellaceae bacterium]
MTEEELNSYRLTSLEEPTDEMLAAIMREAAEEVRKENAETHRRFMEQLREDVRKDKERLGI